MVTSDDTRISQRRSIDQDLRQVAYTQDVVSSPLHELLPPRESKLHEGRDFVRLTTDAQSTEECLAYSRWKNGWTITGVQVERHQL